MLVEPGDHRGGSQRCRRRAAADQSAASPYANAYAQTVATIARDEGHGSDPQALGRKVVRALSRKRMPFRLRVASLDQHFAVVIHDILPSRLYAHILRTYYYK